ncbi:SMC-Scp complex subunit ScpB [Marinimicrobium agarilyticum]|uniref:SMC-Scp complex subunit ScpB n=1 Tax=Marinimicrobium agarilyticum TaxID=306546 RepID=UPI0003F943D2|nr:SMC-Scp complex subunit ScpB [Marinimicrobium agarilyticum]
MTMELNQLRTIIEGALLAAGQPLNLNRLKGLFEEEDAPENDDIRAAIEAIAADCEGRGFELKEVGSGWRFQVRPETAPWVNRLWEEKPQKYSRALLETLALVAYRQPITRGDIEEIRGVAVSSHIIKTLTEREWVKAVGHRDVPGRPALYATTRQFLDYFNLKSLDELPSLGEIRDLSDMNAALDLDGNSAGQNTDRDDDSEADDKTADQGSEPSDSPVEESEPSAGESEPSADEPHPQGEEPETSDDPSDTQSVSTPDAETQAQSPDSSSEHEPNTEAKPSSL